MTRVQPWCLNIDETKVSKGHTCLLFKDKHVASMCVFLSFLFQDVWILSVCAVFSQTRLRSNKEWCFLSVSPQATAPGAQRALCIQTSKQPHLQTHMLSLFLVFWNAQSRFFFSGWQQSGKLLTCNFKSNLAEMQEWSTWTACPDTHVNNMRAGSGSHGGCKCDSCVNYVIKWRASHNNYVTAASSVCVCQLV